MIYWLADRLLLTLVDLSYFFERCAVKLSLRLGYPEIAYAAREAHRVSVEVSDNLTQPDKLRAKAYMAELDAQYEEKLT